MATCVTRTAWRASVATSRSLSTYQKILQNAPVCHNAKNPIIIHIQKRSLIILPLGLDVGLVGVAAYYFTRLRKPDRNNVEDIFGPEPGSKEAEMYPEKVVKGIAHRGAGWDAPENTLEAFKYCVESECNFVELDVRTTKDGKLILLHDEGLERLTWSSEIKDVQQTDWDSIKNIDIGSLHVNRHRFKEVHLCLLDNAIEYLLSKNAKIIIDVKGQDKQVINGIIETFSSRPVLYKHAVVTAFNPFVLYQIRKNDPEIVGAISYRPYCFSAKEYDAENGPRHPRYDNFIYHIACRTADFLHSLVWRYTANWCSVSAVLLHKDIVCPSEVSYWKSQGVRCIGWSVNRPLEKLYWRGGLKCPYLANTLLGEPKKEPDIKTFHFFTYRQNLPLQVVVLELNSTLGLITRIEQKKETPQEDISNGPIVEDAARCR